MATIIRVYIDEGAYREFSLADFGGELPGSGDCILPPVSEVLLDNPIVWAVVGRYFDPGVGFDAESCLRVVVKSRSATALEAKLMQSRC